PCRGLLRDAGSQTLSVAPMRHSRGGEVNDAEDPMRPPPGPRYNPGGRPPRRCAMSRRWMKGPAGAVLLLTTAILTAAPGGAGAGPGEAGRGPRSAVEGRPDLAGIDYVVLIWYRRDDPLGTFQYQSYDVRTGEYTPAVDDWLKEMREKYP